MSGKKFTIDGKWHLLEDLYSANICHQNRINTSKIWWINNSSTIYPLYGIPYLGKEGWSRTIDFATMLTIWEDELKYYTTNYFTSFNLAQSLISNGLTCVGTMKKTKRVFQSIFLHIEREKLKVTYLG